MYIKFATKIKHNQWHMNSDGPEKLKFNNILLITV